MDHDSSATEKSYQDALDNLKKSNKLFSEAQSEVRRDRNTFFEKLTLLQGGAIVISLTLLNLIAAKRVIGVRWSLHIAWGLLLIGLFASIFRNLLNQHYLYSQHFEWWTRDKEKTKRAESELLLRPGQPVIDEKGVVFTQEELGDQLTKEISFWTKTRSDASKKTERAWDWQVVLEHTSLYAFSFGMILLVFFAVANTSD